MYEPGTVLRLREPEGTEDAPAAYDRVEVVGQSPVHHATDSKSAWAGPDAVGFIVRPLGEFAPTVDMPLGQLNALYEVESYPIDPITQEPITPENNPRNQPSPEQLLRRAADEAAALEAARPPRVVAPSLQDNVKSPEQVLRQAEQAAKPTRQATGAKRAPKPPKDAPTDA